jgi:hypothetical protein
MKRAPRRWLKIASAPPDGWARNHQRRKIGATNGFLRKLTESPISDVRRVFACSVTRSPRDWPTGRSGRVPPPPFARARRVRSSRQTSLRRAPRGPRSVPDVRAARSSRPWWRPRALPRIPAAPQARGRTPRGRRPARRAHVRARRGNGSRGNPVRLGEATRTGGGDSRLHLGLGTVAPLRGGRSGSGGKSSPRVVDASSARVAFRQCQQGV